ncbi:MAG TPA: HlyD family secretion protein [Candidatus Acidoferrales bacterium]|nr:HlyD family secretion protein [Candidatus Acidoferrales bacterium]
MEDHQDDIETTAFQQKRGTWLTSRRNIVGLLAFGVGLGLVGGYAINWWITALNTVSTDDARVTASYATISSEVSGKIVKFPADEGDVVRKGDLLLAIEPEEYRNALDEAVAELNRATAQYEEGLLQFKAMEAAVRSEISRAEALVEAARGVLEEKVRMHELAKHVGRSQVEQAAAALKVAEANLARAEVDFKKTALELERARALSAKHLIAAKELDDAQMAHERAQATVEMRLSEVEQLKAELRLAQVSKLNNFRDDANLAEVRARTAKSDMRKAEADLGLSRARLADLEAFKARLESQASTINQLKLKVATRRRQLESTEVTSPVNGVVARRTANIGDIVQRGQPLLKIIIEDTVEVRANVRETYLRHIRAGNPVDIYVDAYPDRVFTGKVKLIGDATDSEFALFKPGGPYTRIEQVIPVEISLDGNSNNRDLKPGMNAWVYIRRNSALEADTARQEARSPARP